MAQASLGSLFALAVCPLAAAAQVSLDGPRYQGPADTPGALPVHATLTLDYTVSQDLLPGGGLQVVLGYLWEDTPILDPRHGDWSVLQVLDPQAESYSSVVSSGSGTFDLAQLPGPPYGFEILPNDPHRPLVAGEVLQMVIGDTSQGGPGYLFSPRTSSVRILVLEQPGPGFPPALAYAPGLYPSLEVGGTSATRVRLLVESVPADGSAIRLKAVVLENADAFRLNSPVVRNYSGTLRFSCEDPLVVLPPDAVFTPADGGVRDLLLQAPAGARFRVSAQEVGNPEVSGISNPVLVPGGEEPLGGLRVFWGSLHAHTAVGGHGLEEPGFAYEYARQVAGLDFFSLSEHAESSISNGEFDWLRLRELGKARSVADRFIGFSGYEWTNHGEGHRTVVFKNAENVPIVAASSPGTGNDVVIEDAGALLDQLRGLNAIAIPHHTAWNLTGLDLGPRLASRVQPLVEIYSWHGSSERSGSPLPIHADPARMHPAGGGFFVQEMLDEGFRFGFTGDGDNHLGRAGSCIGQLHTSSVRYARMGLTGVYAPALTRDAVWDALVKRRTFATTGARILAAFWVNGHFVGEEFVSKGDRVIRVLALGSDVLDRVEILDGSEVIHTAAPMSPVADVRFVDRRSMPGRTHCYYVRVRQIGQADPGQLDPHFAWVSPIWARNAGPAGRPPRGHAERPR